MEYQAIEVVALGKGREVLAGPRRMVIIELYDDGALCWLVGVILWLEWYSRW
jgi:hypothetical protein